jgi:hypothetical protein
MLLTLTKKPLLNATNFFFTCTKIIADGHTC